MTDAHIVTVSSHTMSGDEIASLESVIEKYIPEPELGEVKRILYGKPAR